MSDSGQYPIVWRTNLRYLVHSFVVGFSPRSVWFAVRFILTRGFTRAVWDRVLCQGALAR